MIDLDGSKAYECSVCNNRDILRFNVCKECDDAFWLTRLSKKQHSGCINHSIYDVKYIKKCMKARADKIKELKAQLKEAEKVIELGDYWDELKVNDYLKARKEYKAKYKEGEK